MRRIKVLIDYDGYHTINKPVEPPLYIDEKGRKLFVSKGIGDTLCGTFWRKPSGVLARIKSSRLPMRYTRDTTEQDLHEQAKRKGWRRCVP